MLQKLVAEGYFVSFPVGNDELRGTSPEAAAQVLQWVSFADSEIIPPASAWVFPTLGIMQFNKQVCSSVFSDQVSHIECVVWLACRTIQFRFNAGSIENSPSHFMVCNNFPPWVLFRLQSRPRRMWKGSSRCWTNTWTPVPSWLERGSASLTSLSPAPCSGCTNRSNSTLIFFSFLCQWMILM